MDSNKKTRFNNINSLDERIGHRRELLEGIKLFGEYFDETFILYDDLFARLIFPI